MRDGAPILVHAQPHPMRPDHTFTAEFQAGMSIQEIVGPGANAQVHVWVGGHPVPREWWPHVRPKDGALVGIKVFPGDNSTGRDILLVVVAIASAYTGGTVGAAYGSAWGAAAAVGVSIAGNLLVNALVPLQQPTNPLSGNNYERSNALSGTQNNPNQWGVPPLVLGTIGFFPPLAANPFTEVLGDIEYMRVMLNLGYGNPVVDDTTILIGGTAIADFDNVTYQFGDQSSLSLFANSVTSAGIGDVIDSSSPSVTQTTAAGVTEISVDVMFPSGLFGTNPGTGASDQLASARLLIYYAPAGSGSYVTAESATGFNTTTNMLADDGTGSGTLVIRQCNTDGFSVGCNWQVAAGQYDVLITWVDASGLNTNCNEVVNTMEVWAVNSLTDTVPCTIPGLQFMAMRAQASNQLNGDLARVQLTATQTVDAYDSSGTVSGTSVSSPAWNYVYVLLGAGGANKKPRTTSQIDWPAFYAWAQTCTANGWEYNAVIDTQQTVKQILDDIAASGQATYARNNGLYSIVCDQDQSTPTQVFTPRNSWGLTVQQSFIQPPQALRVQFVNPEAQWQQDEVLVYWTPGGYNDTNTTFISTFQARGCTDANDAWRKGMYQLACLWLRSKTYTFSADIENLGCTRGDMVMISSDLLATTLDWGRIKEVVYNGSDKATSITLDTEVIIQTGVTYAVRMRCQDGSLVLSTLTNSPGVTDTLQLTTPLTGTSVQVNIGDLAVFGISGSTEVQVRVARITYQNGLTAQIECVDRASSIYTSYSGTPPTFVSGITGQPWQDPPPVPQISFIFSGSVNGQVVATSASIQVPVGNVDTGGAKVPKVGIGIKAGNS